MQAHGADRLRLTAGKAILYSRIPKDWSARTPKTLTHAEHPGTTVCWDEQYFEVISAAALPSGEFCYVLAPWRDEHTIRQFVRYDEESEKQRHLDYEKTAKQRRRSVAASLSAVFIGHLPGAIQMRIADELGVEPARMTLASCVPAVALLGACVWVHTGAALRQEVSPIPVGVWIAVTLYFGEAAVRYLVAMSQGRGAGSVLGYLGYALFWLLAPRRRLVSPFASARGYGAPIVPPPPDVARRDAIEVRGFLLTFLPAADQERLRAEDGFDYRCHGFAAAWIVLIVSGAGAVSGLAGLMAGGASLGAWLSTAIAASLAFEQVARLVRLRRAPAGSILAPLVRPLVRDLLERE